MSSYCMPLEVPRCAACGVLHPRPGTLADGVCVDVEWCMEHRFYVATQQ